MYAFGRYFYRVPAAPQKVLKCLKLSLNNFKAIESLMSKSYVIKNKFTVLVIILRGLKFHDPA